MDLSAHKNQLDQLDLTKIASDFINKNDARKHINTPPWVFFTFFKLYK